MKTVWEKIDSQNIEEAKAYLKSREETAQFLISNLCTYGSTLTEHHNSGNFKLIRVSGDVKGVFCLARRGNLLAQTDNDFSSLILNACKEEPIQLKGFIGDWNSVRPIWEKFKIENPTFHPSYQSKEILYKYVLHADDPFLKPDKNVRLLNEKDFESWYTNRVLYEDELNLKSGIPKEILKENFLKNVQNKTDWGLFEDHKLVSMAALNSRIEKIGQVVEYLLQESAVSRDYLNARCSTC